jgi:hypothetical protein
MAPAVAAALLPQTARAQTRLGDTNRIQKASAAISVSGPSVVQRLTGGANGSDNRPPLLLFRRWLYELSLSRTACACSSSSLCPRKRTERQFQRRPPTPFVRDFTFAPLRLTCSLRRNFTSKTDWPAKGDGSADKQMRHCRLSMPGAGCAHLRVESGAAAATRGTRGATSAGSSRLARLLPISCNSEASRIRIAEISAQSSSVADSAQAHSVSASTFTQAPLRRCCLVT